MANMPPRKRTLRDLLLTFGPAALALVIGVAVALKYANPAPPLRIVMSTGDGEGNYLAYAKEYQKIVHQSGVDLQIRTSTGARENLGHLKDPKSDVDVAFVQDGLDTKDQTTHLVSLGSLYYEPLWVFYRGKRELTRFSQFKGLRVAIGERGGGTPALAMRLLRTSGVDKTEITLLRKDYAESAEALIKGDADVAFFLAPPEDPLIQTLAHEKGIRLMSVDQAEATSRQLPYLHRLVLPHGALDLKNNLPEQDIQLVSTTATLVARRNLHPALVDLLLKAATEVHSKAGIFEKKDEFPIDKDYEFPVSDEAKRYFKQGTPFWQRYLPFWLAALLDRFLLVAIPLLAVIVPLVRAIPQFINWRVRSKIYQRYGELKYLETQLKNEKDSQRYAHHLRELDAIEEKVNGLGLPLEFSEHLYVLREHINFVRERLGREQPARTDRTTGTAG